MEHKKLKSFRDLIVWEKSSDLSVLIYKITEKFSNSELYGLISQIRRSVISISSNITEGFKRNHNKEKLQSYNIAHGSVAELESQIKISYKLNFLNEENHNKLISSLIEIGKMKAGLIKSSRKSPKSYILNSILFLIFLCSISYIVNPLPVSAAELFFGTHSKDISLGSKFEVGVFINTQNELINAIEGQIIFPPDSLEFQGFYTGNSLLTFWIQQPVLTSKGVVSFFWNSTWRVCRT